MKAPAAENDRTGASPQASSLGWGTEQHRLYRESVRRFHADEVKPNIEHWRKQELRNTRLKLAEVKTKAEVTRAFIDQCVGKMDRGDLDAATASMAKWWGSQMQCEVADECLQLFGGYGYMTEYPIANAFVDARVQKIYGGANEVMKELIARSLDR